MNFLMGWTTGIVTMTVALNISNTTPVDIHKKYQQEAFDRGYMERVVTENDRVEYKWK